MTTRKHLSCRSTTTPTTRPRENSPLQFVADADTVVAGDVGWWLRVGNPMNACATLLGVWKVASLRKARTHIVGRTTYEAMAA